MTRILIVGPPGSGKGTQAERIAERLHLPAISTGEIFRGHVRRQTDLGIQARQHLENGDFVPDSITNGMILERLEQPDAAEGFLLDGYPRTLEQAKFLDQVLAEMHCGLDIVLLLTADDEELVPRLLKRALSEGRADDTEDVIRHRLALYRQQTEVVVSKYEQLGILASINGGNHIDEVTEHILQTIALTLARLVLSEQGSLHDL